MSQATSPEQVVIAAQAVADSLVETHYTHNLVIDPDAGIYDVDCSGFVS